MIDAKQSIAGGGTTSLDDNNALRRQFYCPSNPSQNVDGLWNLGGGNQPVIGYPYMNDRNNVINGTMVKAGNDSLWSQAAGGTVFNAINLTRSPKLDYQSRFVAVTEPSNRELLFDTVITYNSSDPPGGPYNWSSGGPGGGYGVVNHETSHMAGARPAGMNVGCFDSHVEWRKFPPAGATGKRDVWRTTQPSFWLVRP